MRIYLREVGDINRKNVTKRDSVLRMVKCWNVEMFRWWDDETV